MGDGFAVANHHVGSIRSNLGYYVRDQDIGVSYMSTGRSGFQGYEFSSGDQIGGGVGVTLRVQPGIINISADEFYIRSDTGSPRLLITQESPTSNTFTQYSPDTNSTYKRQVTNAGYTQTLPGGDYSISTDQIGWVGESTFPSTTNIGTNNVNSDLYIGAYGVTVLNSGAGSTMNIYSGTGGITIVPNGGSIGGTTTNLTATSAGNGANTGYVNIDSSYNSQQAITIRSATINLGTGGTRTINFGSNAAGTVERFYISGWDQTNGGANMPTNGPNGTTTAGWIPIQNESGSPMYLFFVY